MKKTAGKRGKKTGPVREEQRITAFFSKLEVKKTSKTANKVLPNKEHSSSDDDCIILDTEDTIKSNHLGTKSKIKQNKKENTPSPPKIKNGSSVKSPVESSHLSEDVNFCDLTKSPNSLSSLKLNSTPNIKKRSIEIDSPDIIPSTPQEIVQRMLKNKSNSCSDNKFDKTAVEVIKAIIKKQSSSPPSKKPCNKPLVGTLSTERPSNSQTLDGITPVKLSPLKEIILNNPVSPGKSNLKLKRALFDSKISCAPKIEEKGTMSANDELEGLFDDDWGQEIEIVEHKINELNLETWQYCKILEVSKDNHQNIILKLQSLNSTQETVCILQGVWQYSILQPEDIINILAIKYTQDIPFCINNDKGFLVFEPDVLVSPTSIVGSQFCNRRGILSEKFRGFDPENKIMIIGTLVHKLLQDVLKKEIYKVDLVEKKLNEILSSKEMIFTSYSSQIPIEDLKKELILFVPKVVDFIENYVRINRNKTQNQRNPDNWKGKIQAIQDIEENIWSPELGLKGKIDITVKTDNFGSILPLELKTGRASMSLEHRGQVALYIMIMNELGYKVSSGLLLYLREDVLSEVKVGHRERRDLIMLRNQFVYYLKQKPKIPENEMNSEQKIQFSQLPEPINHHSACAKCPYSNLCVVLLSRDESYTLSENNPLKKISDEYLQHLKPSHIDYFIHWTSLLTLESSYKPPLKEIKDIWHLPPYKRESRGKSLCYLKIASRVTELKDNYAHKFKRASDKKITDLINEKGLQTNFLLSGLSSGNYVVISTDTRSAVSTGFISDITDNSVTVLLERDLNERYSNKIFHLDTYESQQIVNFSTTSVASLLEPTDRAKKLRELIIDRKESEILGLVRKSDLSTSKGILAKLNVNQQRAVLTALTVKDYLLIKGMPGTGKTATITALIQVLVKLNKSVLITSHTHSAVDNLCLRLLEKGVDFLRLGNENRVHPLLKEHTETFLTSRCNSVEEIQEVFNNAKIIAVTCLGSNHPVLSQRTLDYCIIDESTQVLQCTLIKPLLSCKSFILIGDPEQLTPLVKNPEALRRNMNESLFERLADPKSTIILKIQYRMNRIITDLANNLTYNGELICAEGSLSSAVLNLPNFEILKSTYRNRQWILDILDLKLENSVVAVDTGPTWPNQPKNEDLLDQLLVAPQNVQEDENRKCNNHCEAFLVVSIIQALKIAGLNASSIGVIAPYRDQVYLLKKLVENIYENEEPEVNTVDQYQGRDKEVIIYSCTRSRDTSKPRNKSGFELLDDKRRLTVAITRAKYKLIIIGDFQCLEEYSPFKSMLESLEIHQKIFIKEEKYGFNWEEARKQFVE